MIGGLDSSFDRPTPVDADAARAAGVGIWSGYLATRAGIGLAAAWSQVDFDVARRCGGAPLAFCSGWDDPGQLRTLAAAWRVRLVLDVEDGIRGDGSWVPGWLQVSGAGLYGLPAVHAHDAPFHIVANYPGGNPLSTWPLWLTRPPTPCGWQWQGTHTEFGLSVDRGWYDDWFGGPMALDPNDPTVADLRNRLGAIQAAIGVPNADGELLIRLRSIDQHTGVDAPATLAALKAEMDTLKAEVEAGGDPGAAAAIARIEKALQGA